MIRAMAAWMGAGLMRAAGMDPNDPRLWQPYVGGRVHTQAKQVVTVERAQQLSIVTDCLDVITSPIASLPLKVYRRLPSRKGPNGQPVEGGKQELDLPIAEVLGERPNDEQTAYEFRGMMEWDRATHGNAYAEVVPGRRGAVDQLIRIDPTRVVVRKPMGSRRAVYQVTGERGEPTRVLRRDQVWHLKNLPLESDGLTGKSPIKMHAELFGGALAVEEYGNSFFANDATPGGIIKYPGRFADPESRENYARAWYKAHGPGRRHRPFVAEGGGEWQSIGIDPEKAQMIETDRERALKISRVWHVQPHKVGILDKATFSNIEQQAIEFLTDTMLPRFTCWEQAINELIILQTGVFAEFVVNGLLRGDIKTRYEAYAIARNWGWLSVNDILALENRNPIGPEGDIYLQPLNMVPAGQKTDPAAVAQANGFGRVLDLRSLQDAGD